MKREEVLLYINSNKIYIYLKNKKKEIIKKIDTSSFFKYGEIYNEQKFIDILDREFNEKFLLKPNVTILYNDICNSDIKFLYKEALINLGFNNISFIGYNDLFLNNKFYNRLVILDGDYYIFLKEKDKRKSLSPISYKPVIIGTKENEYTHYADDNYIYNEFKKYVLKMT